MPRRKRLRSASLAHSCHASLRLASYRNWWSYASGGVTGQKARPASAVRPIAACHYHRHSSYASSQCLFASLGTALNGLRHGADAGLEADAGSDRCAIQNEPRSPGSCPEMFRGPASRPASTPARSECMLWRERTNLPFLPVPAWSFAVAVAVRTVPSASYHGTAQSTAPVEQTAATCRAGIEPKACRAALLRTQARTARFQGN